MVGAACVHHIGPSYLMPLLRAQKSSQTMETDVKRRKFLYTCWLGIYSDLFSGNFFNPLLPER